MGRGTIPIRLDATAVFTPTLLLASFALLAIVVHATGMRIDWAGSGFGLCIGFSIVTTALGLLLKLTGGSPRLANFVLVLAALIGSTMCNTMAVNAGLRLRFPLVDAQLLGADHMLGFDPVRIVGFCADHPRFTALLDLIYVNSNWIAVLVVLLHSLRREHAWVPLVCYSGGLLVISAIFILMPAMDNVAYNGLAYLQQQGLPAGAGTYHLPIFHYYRDGTGDLIDNAHLSGVAVFPSFHTVMGMIIVTSLHGTRLRGLGATFGIGTILSALPIGGHYVVDILGGIVIWLLAMRIAGAPWQVSRAAFPNRLRWPVARQAAMPGVA